MPEAKLARPGGRTAAVRSRVLAATLEVLASGGTLPLSVESVARQSGVHKTTIYRRWGDCGALVKEAIAEQENSIAPIPDTGSLKGDLAELARAYGAFFSDPILVAIGRLIVSQRGSDTQLGGWMDEYWLSRTELYRDIIHRAIARGELKQHADITIILELLIGPIVMRTLLTQQPIDSEFLRRLTESAYAYLLQLAT